MWEIKVRLGLGLALNGRTTSALQGLAPQCPVRQPPHGFPDPRLCSCVRPWGCQVGVASRAWKARGRGLGSVGLQLSGVESNPVRQAQIRNARDKSSPGPREQWLCAAARKGTAIAPAQTAAPDPAEPRPGGFGSSGSREGGLTDRRARPRKRGRMQKPNLPPVAYTLGLSNAADSQSL